MQTLLRAKRYLPVGASLLAKVVNDNAALLVYRSALAFFASKLAPT
ncbi:outer membrane lipoprotein carrier protein LolA, partial [Pseudomonas veronii]